MPKAVSPVVRGLEPYEIRFGGNGYEPLPALRGSSPTYIVSSRWRFTDEERAAIAAGADVIISQLTFGGLYQPTSLAHVVKDQMTDEELDLVIDSLGLNDELSERFRKFFPK